MFKDYFKELKKVKLLTEAEEAELWRRYKDHGEISARQELVERYQPLVFKIVMALHPRESIAMDMMQEGIMGLMEAVDRFEPKRQLKFVTYAPFRIRGSIMNYIEREKLKGARVDYDDDLLAMIKVESGHHDGIMGGAQEMERFEKLVACIKELPDKERMVMEATFLHDRSTESILRELDISASYLSRLKKNATKRLRGSMGRFLSK